MNDKDLKEFHPTITTSEVGLTIAGLLGNFPLKVSDTNISGVRTQFAFFRGWSSFKSFKIEIWGVFYLTKE